MESVEEFLSLSSELTGFESIELRGAAVGEEYLRWLIASFPAVLGDLLEVWRRILADYPPSEREVHLRRDVMADPRLGPFARSLVVLWYTATWNALPEEWSAAYGGGASDASHVFGGAYAEGLAWKAARAHPVGAKPTGFGSWALAPGEGR
jgi:hypothetical protein